MRVRPKYVVEDVDRHGNVRLYFRRKGQPKLRLPDIGAPEFASAYRVALSGASPKTAKRAAIVTGSIRELCVEYFKSAQFTRLDFQTQKTRRGILDRFCQRNNSWGEPYCDKPLALVLLVRRGTEIFTVGAHCTRYHGPLAELATAGQVRRLCCPQGNMPTSRLVGFCERISEQTFLNPCLASSGVSVIVSEGPSDRAGEPPLGRS